MSEINEHCLENEIKENKINEIIYMVDELNELKELKELKELNDNDKYTKNTEKNANQENKMEDEEENNDDFCPYLDGNININLLRNLIQSTITQDFRKIIPDKINHLNTILTIYRFIFTNLTTFNSIDDIETKDIDIRQLDFRKLFSEKNRNLNRNINSFKVQQKKIMAYKKLLDLCFSYFIWLIDSSAPFLQYTSNKIKYILITNTIQLNKYTSEIITNLIGKIIEFFSFSYENKFIQELVKYNSVYITFEYSLDEVILKMNNELNSITKNLINNLISLDNEIMKLNE